MLVDKLPHELRGCFRGGYMKGSFDFPLASKPASQYWLFLDSPESRSNLT